MPSGGGAGVIFCFQIKLLGYECFSQTYGGCHGYLALKDQFPSASKAKKWITWVKIGQFWPNTVPSGGGAGVIFRFQIKLLGLWVAHEQRHFLVWTYQTKLNQWRIAFQLPLPNPISIKYYCRLLSTTSTTGFKYYDR